MNTLQEKIENISRNAKKTSRTIATLSTETKNSILQKIADTLVLRKKELQRENERDLLAAKKRGMSAAMIDRLTLSDAVVNSMIEGIMHVISLPDPVGRISGLTKQAKGIMVGQMRIPLGVVCMIYESRPNVTVDAAALCLKAGNSVILRGGSEAFHSNMALAEILQEALKTCGIEPETIQVVPFVEREAVSKILEMDNYIDLIIPRGGEGLIRFVSENSRIPVLKHYKGVCHIFVDKDADLEKAIAIIVNAKTQRPGVCNALEGLLVDENVAKEFLPVLGKKLAAEGVRMLGCKKAMDCSEDIEAASEDDWGTEFLDLVMCIKVVAGYDEARDYIQTYGSQHTESILTENYSLANRFIKEIDASAVMVNASTRFNDGGQLGLGTEIGISTSKLHAYGPMGLEELTTRKFIVFGEGQVRD